MRLSCKGQWQEKKGGRFVGGKGNGPGQLLLALVPATGGSGLSESCSFFNRAPVDVTGSPGPRGEPPGYVAAWEYRELGQKTTRSIR